MLPLIAEVYWAPTVCHRQPKILFTEHPLSLLWEKAPWFSFGQYHPHLQLMWFWGYCCLAAQSYLTLWDSMDHSMPGFLPCLSPSPRVCSNSCLLSWWCHPTISSSVIPFASCLQSFPASGSFPVSQFYTSGGQSIGASASASVLPMNSVQFRCSVMSNSLRFHGLQHTRLPCPSPTPGAYANSCP